MLQIKTMQTTRRLILLVLLMSSLAINMARADSTQQESSAKGVAAASKQPTEKKQSSQTAAKKAAPLTAKQKDIQQIVALQDVSNVGGLMVEELINSLKEVVINVPDTVWDDIQDGISTQRLLEAQQKFYEGQLSEEEAKTLRQFFQTPAGAKYLQLEEQRGEQLMQEVQRWSQRTLRVVVIKLQGKGYQVPPQLLQAMGGAGGQQGYGAGPPGFGGGPPGFGSPGIR